MKISEWMIRLLFPPRCIFCEALLPLEREEGYCTTCYYKLPIKHPHRCLICSRELYEEAGYRICPLCQKYPIRFDAAYSPFLYDGILREVVLKYKFAGKMWYAKTLAAFLFEELRKNKVEADCIVYPPINRKTFLKRGYNQAELLGEKLSKLLKIPCYRGMLKKARETQKQSLTPLHSRFSNVRGAFVIPKGAELIKNKHVLFVDDVLTTGATASSCATVLKKNGAKMVTVISICITR